MGTALEIHWSEPDSLLQREGAVPHSTQPWLTSCYRKLKQTSIEHNKGVSSQPQKDGDRMWSFANPLWDTLNWKPFPFNVLLHINLIDFFVFLFWNGCKRYVVMERSRNTRLEHFTGKQVHLVTMMIGYEILSRSQARMGRGPPQCETHECVKDITEWALHGNLESGL